MKEGAPALLPLLRSRSQGDILAWLFLFPDGPVTLTALAERLGVSVATVSRNADRLAEAGLLIEERVGPTRLVRVNTASRLFPPLANVMAVTFGPLPVLTEMLTGVPGVEEAFIYGSWAARYTGHPGHVPNDIDVLVVGTPDPGRINALADDASRLLRRDINIRHVAPDKVVEPRRRCASRRGTVTASGGTGHRSHAGLTVARAGNGLRRQCLALARKTGPV